jgi:hypothetical protein
MGHVSHYYCYAQVTGMNVFMPTILAFNYPHASPIRIQLLFMSPNM